mgnify:CR=1 FL=1
MGMLARLSYCVALVLLIPGAIFARPAAPVQATSLGAFNSCLFAPSEANCTHQDPQLTGCNNDAFTLGYSEADPYLGLQVAVRYSPTCQSAWARVVNLSTVANSSINAIIVRNDGVSAASPVATLPRTAEVSPMVFLGTDSSAQAVGRLFDSRGVLQAQLSTPLRRP